MGPRLCISISNELTDGAAVAAGQGHTWRRKTLIHLTVTHAHGTAIPLGAAADQRGASF